MLNLTNFAQRSTPQQAECHMIGHWPLLPLSTIDPRSLRREPRHQVDDSLMPDELDRLKSIPQLQLWLVTHKPGVVTNGRAITLLPITAGQPHTHEHPQLKGHCYSQCICHTSSRRWGTCVACASALKLCVLQGCPPTDTVDDVVVLYPARDGRNPQDDESLSVR